jgi:cytochrome c553
VDCHARGEVPVNHAYPRLAGHYRQDLVQRLLLMQARKRGRSEFVHVMHVLVDRLTRAQIDVASHFGSPEANGHSDPALVTHGH